LPSVLQQFTQDLAKTFQAISQDRSTSPPFHYHHRQRLFNVQPCFLWWHQKWQNT